MASKASDPTDESTGSGAPAEPRQLVTTVYFAVAALAYSLVIKLLNCVALADTGPFKLHILRPPLTVPFLLGEDLLITAAMSALLFLALKNRISKIVAQVIITVYFVFLALDQMAYKMFYTHLNFTFYREGQDIVRLWSSIVDLVDAPFVIALIFGLGFSVLMWLSWRPRFVVKLTSLIRRRKRTFLLAAVIYVALTYVIAAVENQANLHRAFFVEAAQTIAPSEVGEEIEISEGEWFSPTTLFGKAQPDEDFSGIRGNIESNRTRMNVVFYIMESTPLRESSMYPGARYDTTPFAKKLASEGLFFENYYCVHPGSSRANFGTLTGIFTYIYGNSDITRFADINVKTLSDLLYENGYRTALYASGDTWWDSFDKFLHRHSFDDYFDSNSVPVEERGKLMDYKWGLPEEVAVDAALKWVKSVKDGDHPFYLQYMATYPHSPYSIPAKYEDIKKMDWGGEDVGREKKAYRAAVYYADSAVKRLFQGLEQLGVADNTLFILAPDHGETHKDVRPMSTRVHSATTYDENSHIFLIFHNKQLFPTPYASSRVGSQYDFVKTTSDILGIDDDFPTYGRSMVSLDYPERPLYLNSMNYFGMRDGNFKFMWHKRDKETLLFDLSTDPDEKNNVADAHPKEVKEYKRRIVSWGKTVADQFERLQREEHAQTEEAKSTAQRQLSTGKRWNPIKEAFICRYADRNDATKPGSTPILYVDEAIGLKIRWKKPGTYVVRIHVEDPDGKRASDKLSWCQDVKGTTTRRIGLDRRHPKPGVYSVRVEANHEIIETSFELKEKE